MKYNIEKNIKTMQDDNNWQCNGHYWAGSICGKRSIFKKNILRLVVVD